MGIRWGVISPFCHNRFVGERMSRCPFLYLLDLLRIVNTDQVVEKLCRRLFWKEHQDIWSLCSVQLHTTQTVSIMTTIKDLRVDDSAARRQEIVQDKLSLRMTSSQACQPHQGQSKTKWKSFRYKVRLKTKTAQWWRELYEPPKAALFLSGRSWSTITVGNGRESGQIGKYFWIALFTGMNANA